MTMSGDDDQPHTPRNPFIRFKNHVNTRIGAGISLITRSNTQRDDIATTAPPQPGDSYGRPCEMPPFDRARRRREPTEGFRYWDKWAQLDPYSPYNLRHLPQPIPNDLPRDVDAGHFGFHEAFEDLMAVSGLDNGSMMDLRGRADLKKSILKTFASGEPPLVWVRRLHGNGLLPPPFIWESSRFLAEVRGQSEQVLEQGQQTEQQQHRPASMWEWFDERRKMIESPEEMERKCADDVEALKGLAGKMMKDFEEMGMSWDDMMEKLDKDITFNPAEMFRKAEQTLRALEKEIERYADELASGNVQTRTPDEAKPASDDQQEQPGTEQDLFSMIRSAVAGADRSLNNFAKSITDMASPPADWQAERGRSEKHPAGETVEYDSFGGKTVTTTSEHTDTFGNVHSQTEVRRINADGVEVGRQTHYSVHSPSDSESQQSSELRRRQSMLLEQQNERHSLAREAEHGSWPEQPKKSAEQYRGEKTESGNKNGNSSGWFWR
ncbi:hypothetical protein VSDG_03785 [Cytospora chrysosperma]|uniref:Uncharacterized protein n=1 Tax=Cytospora chrysosperma TaxID=252740 RepID=A0A423W6F7_CYTCH|nr:hypothetical protein VSDG_03785 [Valsa sordida]